jgi:hypothetical protein
MNGVPEDNASMQKALTGGALQLIGAYRFYFDQERWRPHATSSAATSALL